MVDTVLSVLEDGTWHYLAEVEEKSDLQQFKLDILADFLTEYDFMKFNRTERKIRLAASVVDFLRKIKHIEIDQR